MLVAGSAAVLEPAAAGGEGRSCRRRTVREPRASRHGTAGRAGEVNGGWRVDSFASIRHRKCAYSRTLAALRCSPCRSGNAPPGQRSPWQPQRQLDHAEHAPRAGRGARGGVWPPQAHRLARFPLLQAVQHEYEASIVGCFVVKQSMMQPFVPLALYLIFGRGCCATPRCVAIAVEAHRPLREAGGMAPAA